MPEDIRVVKCFYEDYDGPLYGYNSLAAGGCFYCEKKLPEVALGYIDFMTNGHIIAIRWFCSEKHRAKWMKDMGRPLEMEVSDYWSPGFPAVTTQPK